MNGALAFVDTSDCTMMNIAEHYMASDVEWDPTGRYVVTSVSWWSHKVLTAPPPPQMSDQFTVRSWTFPLTLLCLPCVGGQCVLAVDIPGSSPSEEQQGPLLSAALETQTSYPPQCRPDQGIITFIYYPVTS